LLEGHALIDQCQALQLLLYEDIPLTRAMQLKVLSWQAEELRLGLPLHANSNHHNSMFGGSLYSAAVLAGWGWLHLRLQQVGIVGGIVIKDAQISYLLPVNTAAQACCAAPPPGAWDQFVSTYQRRGLARLALQTQVLTDAGEVAVRFAGEYVLQR
jgi:thioesterase domain-containing protein